jgi:hypothetical protein
MRYMSVTPGVPYKINVDPSAADYTHNIRVITHPIPSKKTMTFAILHELGHLLGVLPADPTKDQQLINNDLIQAECFPMAGNK